MGPYYLQTKLISYLEKYFVYHRDLLKKIEHQQSSFYLLALILVNLF